MSLLLVIQERHKTAQSCRHQEALYLRKIELQKCNLLTILCEKGDTECKLSEKKNRVQIHSPFPKDPSKSNEILGDFSTILFSRMRTKCTHVNFSSRRVTDTTWFMTH